MQIRTYPDPILKEETEKIEDFSAELARITEEMIKHMYLFQGVGLASLQVGITKRVFVFDASEDRDEPMIMINPEITGSSKERQDFEEGCLSVPGIRQNVKRPISIVLAWQDLEGTSHEQEFDGLAARVIQHELDHINGILFIERLSTMQKIFIKKDLKKLGNA
ncbi:peptide deformylase [Planctomycetota bacterium]